MNLKRVLSTIAAMAFMTSVGLTTLVAHAAEESFTDYAHTTMNKLDKLYLQYVDHNTPRGEAEKAKREYFQLARQLLQKMNATFDQIEAKERPHILPQEESFISIHVLTMLLDMMAYDYQAEWQYPAVE